MGRGREREAMVPLADATGSVPTRTTRSAADVGECGATTVRPVALPGLPNSSASGLFGPGNSHPFRDRHPTAIQIDLRLVPEPQAEPAGDLNSICGPSCAPGQTRHEVVGLTNLLQRIQHEDRLRFARATATQFARILHENDESHGMFEVCIELLSATIIDALSQGLLRNVPSKAAIPQRNPKDKEPPRIANQSTSHRAKRRGRQLAGPSTTETVSPRERTILTLIGSGQSNKQIARTLEIAPETVKSHIKNLFLKLGVERRAQAVACGQRLHLF